MGDTKLPSNIRQIGNISGGLKIYIEDFVYTYLNQYAEAGDYCEKIAFLVGKVINIGGDDVLFICGAVQGKNTIISEGTEIFGEKSFEFAEEQIEKYFEGMEIVGWMQSQPGYSTRLNPVYAEYHKNNFTLRHQVMFILDPIEKLNVFYAWNKEDELAELSGYFIYYDKNNGMQEYMLQNRTSKYKVRESVTPYGDKELSFSGEPPVKPIRSKYQTSYSNPSSAGYGSKARGVAAARKPEASRMSNMLITLSAVLFVICFIMGAGLIQNESRITALEKDLSDLTVSYVFLQDQVKQGSQSVFAGKETPFATTQGTTQTASPDTLSPNITITMSPANPLTTQPASTVNPTVEPTVGPVSEQPTQSPSTSSNVVTYDVPDSYTVQPGDSLSFISRYFYGTGDMIEEIMRENGMSDPNMIFAGKVLKLPKTVVVNGN